MSTHFFGVCTCHVALLETFNALPRSYVHLFKVSSDHATLVRGRVSRIMELATTHVILIDDLKLHGVPIQVIDRHHQVVIFADEL